MVDIYLNMTHYSYLTLLWLGTVYIFYGKMILCKKEYRHNAELFYFVGFIVILVFPILHVCYTYC